jgi:hypothetical protein
MEQNFQEYLKNWDKEYKAKISNLPICQPDHVKTWTDVQKKEFARVFYHARGHFIDFLWFLGNFSNSKEIKDMVINNISEELNGSAQSHEIMYVNFAKELGVDLEPELLNKNSYPDFIKQFNAGHIEYLASNNQENRIAAFAAYERLDNVDYMWLYSCAKTMTESKKALLFFLIHTRVEHFAPVEKHLEEIWQNNPDSVIDGFNFIADHQINMWKNLGNYIISV